MTNYKVFEDHTISLNNGLNIFSGPNGYGKTSFFDAVEFLITGTMRRIKENDAIDGKRAFATNFLARNPKKDVIIRGEFVSDNQTEGSNFTVVKCIRQGTSKKQNNPKNLEDITTTYILNSFDASLESGEQYNRHPNEKLCNLLGENSQSRYQTIYYIEQEDRLNFFKYKERERVYNLEFLFGINEEIQRLHEIKNAVSKLAKISKAISSYREVLEQQLTPSHQSANTLAVDYLKLLSVEKKWDAKDVIITTIDERDTILSELATLKAFRENLDSYMIDVQNQKITQLLNDELSLKYYVYNGLIGLDKNAYTVWSTSYSFLTTQLSLIESKELLQIDFLTLGDYVESSEDIELVSKIKKIETSTSQTQNSLVELMRLREELKVAYRKSINDELSICPFCGQDWVTTELLNEKFDKRKTELTNKMQLSSKELIVLKEQLMQRIENVYLPLINTNLQSIKENSIFSFYREKERQIHEAATSVSAQLKELGIEFVFTGIDNSKLLKDNCALLAEKIKLAKQDLPDSYYGAKNKYKFEQVFNSSFANEAEARILSLASINKKVEYIKYRFVICQEEKREQLNTIKETEAFISTKLDAQISQYMQAYDESIAEYREQIIAAIEIPFFIYSSRILQSYPEGRDFYRHGVVLQTNKASKLSAGIDSIRFVAPGKDHDILYTMSSGQLSGVLLSFTLALYKTFSDTKLNTLFIDDPVQSMDELNIISFVELLKSEFSGIQLIISTHEESFAQYAHYKYQKTKISTQVIHLNEQVKV
ncbi:MAG: AAA family ATPase [Cloacibacillus porcorum]|nr:AAA family ATPase [Cloacibacillus porcorum]